MVGLCLLMEDFFIILEYEQISIADQLACRGVIHLGVGNGIAIVYIERGH